MRSSCFSLVILALLQSPLSAFAEEPEAPAKVLFKEARALAAKGDYAAACPKFEQSLALEVGLGTQFNLADCWEHIGRNASAQALFLGAAASAKAAGQAEREQVLRDRAEALDPRLSKLVIEVPSMDAKPTVKRNDLPIDQESWGKAVAVDPGEYTILVKAPGYKFWRKKLEVTAEAAVITVKVPVLEKLTPKEKAAEPALAVQAPAKAEAAPATAPTAPASDRDRDRAPGLNYSVVGLGAVGVGALTFASVMAYRYKSANDDAEGICPTSHDCTERDIADHDLLVNRASSARSWAFVGLGAGVASLGGAAALYIMQQPRRRSSASAWQATPVVSETGLVGASVSGSF